jgi:hypothetical protein
VKYELGFYIPEDDILHSHRRENLRSYNLIQIYFDHLFGTADGISPGGSGTTIRPHTHAHITQNNTPLIKNKIEHEGTQTVRDILHPMYTMQTSKNKSNSVTGLGGLWSCDMSLVSDISFGLQPIHRSQQVKG